MTDVAGTVEIPEIKEKELAAGEGLPTPSLETQLKTAQVGEQREEDYLAHFQERTSELYEKKLMELGQVPEPKLADPSAQAPKPDFKMNKQFIIASSALLALSAVGSLAMRTGADGMMSALTGALQGLHAGRKEVYDREMARYQQIYKETLDKNNLELERYKTILNQKNKTLQEIVTEWNREWTHHGNMLKGYQYTINNINRIMGMKQAMIDRFKAQVNLATKKGQTLTATEKDWLFSTQTEADRRGIPVEQIRKEVTFPEWFQAVHPDVTLQRSMKKKAELAEYPALKYGIKSKDEIPDPKTLPEGTKGETTEGIKLIIKDGKWTIRK